MPLEIDLKIEGLPKTSFECAQQANEAMKGGLLGVGYYGHGLRFLLDASRSKNPRPQAQSLVLSWCHFSRALRYDDCPDNCETDFLPFVVKCLRSGLDIERWPSEIDRPLKKQLSKARSRKRCHVVSRNAVKAFGEFRAVFVLEGSDIAEGLNSSMFSEPWCLPAIDRYLDYWRDQLALIQMRIAETEQ